MQMRFISFLVHQRIFCYENHIIVNRKGCLNYVRTTKTLFQSIPKNTFYGFIIPKNIPWLVVEKYENILS